jgi:hypothetical protein
MYFKVTVPKKREKKEKRKRKRRQRMPQEEAREQKQQMDQRSNRGRPNFWKGVMMKRTIFWNMMRAGARRWTGG